MLYSTTCGLRTGLWRKRYTGIVIDLTDDGNVDGLLCPNYNSKTGLCNISHHSSGSIIDVIGVHENCEYKNLKIDHNKPMETD